MTSTTAPTPTRRRRKGASNPGFTTLKHFGRTHRDEPFHLVYPLVLYPKNGEIVPDVLSDWCAVRYLHSRKKVGTRYRIETYGNRDGKRYVHRIMLEGLTEDEQVELAFRFGTEFLKNKIVRNGRLRRPRLTKDEKKDFDAMREQFYAEVSARRRAAAAANR